MVRWPCAGPPPAWWLRRKTSASSSATNCSGYSKSTWTNRATDNWPTTGTLDRVFPSGAARHLQLRGGHHQDLLCSTQIMTSNLRNSKLQVECPLPLHARLNPSRDALFRIIVPQWTSSFSNKIYRVIGNKWRHAFSYPRIPCDP